MDRREEKGRRSKRKVKKGKQNADIQFIPQIAIPPTKSTHSSVTSLFHFFIFIFNPWKKKKTRLPFIPTFTSQSLNQAFLFSSFLARRFS